MSQDFIVSKYIRDNEVPAALARHRDGSAVVIPVVLSAYTWVNSPFGKVQSAPRDMQDVMSWPDRKKAWKLVSEEIQAEAIHQAAQAAAVVQAPQPAPPPPPPPPPPEPPAPAPAKATATAAAPSASRPQPPAPTPPSDARSRSPGPTPPRPAAPQQTDFRDVVLAALQRAGKHSDFFVAPNIPEAKRKNAFKACGVQGDDQVLGLIDLTVFGSASDACIFGRKRFYFHNDGGNPKDFVLPYASFANGVFGVDKAGGIEFARGTSLHWTCGFDSAAAVGLFKDLSQAVKQALRDGHGDEPAAAAPDTSDEPAAAAPDASDDADDDLPFTVVPGPRFTGSANAKADKQVTAQVKQALQQDIERLTAHRVPGSLLVLYAALGDSRADVCNLLITQEGELMLAAEGNDDLPESLRLGPDAQQGLVDTLDMVVMQPPGWTHAVSLGPIASVGSERPMLATMYVLALFGLPHHELQVGWDQMLKKR